MVDKSLSNMLERCAPTTEELLAHHKTFEVSLSRSIVEYTWFKRDNQVCIVYLQHNIGTVYYLIDIIIRTPKQLHQVRIDGPNEKNDTILRRVINEVRSTCTSTSMPNQLENIEIAEVYRMVASSRR